MVYLLTIFIFILNNDIKILNTNTDWLSEAVNYSITTDIIHKNITEIEKEFQNIHYILFLE